MRFQFENSVFLFLEEFSVYGREISKKLAEIYSKRESENSQGSFGFERARKVNFRTLSKNFEKLCASKRYSI